MSKLSFQNKKNCSFLVNFAFQCILFVCFALLYFPGNVFVGVAFPVAQVKFPVTKLQRTVRNTLPDDFRICIFSKVHDLASVTIDLL